jgi:pantetheine-phosphate adenylyltransferase
VSHALFAGSFDPFTLGHLDLVERGTARFDRVTVLLAVNSGKTPLLPLEQRLEAIRASVAHLPGVDVQSYTGLVVEYARRHGADVLLRGLRGTADLEFEAGLAQLNRGLEGGMDTLFLLAAPEHYFVTSTLVRELFRHGDQFRRYVPDPVARALEALRPTGGLR